MKNNIGLEVGDFIWVKNPPEGKDTRGLVKEVRDKSVLANFETFFDYVIPFGDILAVESKDEEEEEDTKKIMKNKIYLVVSSSGDYEDYITINHKAYSNPIEAEKEKDFIIKKCTEVPDFPLDCKEYEVYELFENGTVTNEEFEKYDEWCDLRNDVKDFNTAWVEEIDLL